MNMVFDYKIYLNNAFVLPVAFSLMALFFNGYYIINLIFSITKGKRIEVQSILFTLFFFIISCIVTYDNYTILTNGGIYLFSENEDDAVVESGMIESICEPSERITRFKSDYGYGADIIINGERYFAMTCKGFNEGDKVTVLYLPKSHFILNIKLLE